MDEEKNQKTKRNPSAVPGEKRCLYAHPAGRGKSTTYVVAPKKGTQVPAPHTTKSAWITDDRQTIESKNQTFHAFARLSLARLAGTYSGPAVAWYCVVPAFPPLRAS